MVKKRRFIGDILIIFTVAFIVYLSVIMVHRINTVVLRDNYVMMFCAELVICAFFLLFALDVRFGLFTRMRSKV